MTGFTMLRAIRVASALKFLRPGDAKLKSTYDSKDAVPDALRPYYVERGGKWVVDVEGGDDGGSVVRLESALRKEKSDHKATKDALAGWKALGESPEKVHEQLDRIPELEVLSKGKVDEDKLAGMVDARVKAETAKLTREVARLSTEKATLEASNGELTTTIKSGKIENALRAAAVKQGLAPTAIDDAVSILSRNFEVADDGAIVTKESTGVKGGLDAVTFIEQQRASRPHFWPASVSGGAGGNNGGGGGGGKNPWSREHFNLTEQGRVVNEKGIDVATQMATAVGSRIGATHAPEAAK